MHPASKCCKTLSKVLPKVPKCCLWHGSETNAALLYTKVLRKVLRANPLTDKGN